MRRFDHKLLAGRPPAYLGLHVEAAQNSVDDVCQVTIYSQDIAFTQFYEDVKCGSRLAFENTLLCPATLCFFITQRNRLDTSEPVSYTHLRAHETRHDLVCRLLLEKKKKKQTKKQKHNKR